MNNYFSLTIEEQRQVLQAAEGRIGLPAQAIEKDLWVTIPVSRLFPLRSIKLVQTLLKEER